MIHVYLKGAHVAMIVKPTKAADNYSAAEPWSLLHNSGRIDRFAQIAEAREEATKSYGRVEFKRS